MLSHSHLPGGRSAVAGVIAAAFWLGLTAVAAAFDPANGDFSKENADHIRVLTWNVLDNFVTDASLTSNEFTDILQNIDPDIVCFQEMDTSETAADIKTALETILGNTWTVQRGLTDGFNRNMLATRFSLGTTTTDTSPASELRGVTAGLVDLPDGTYGSDFYVMCIHFKSGATTTDATRRQTAADAIVNWMRDARNSGGNITLASNTPMLVVGDTNFVNEGEAGPGEAPTTLATGDIADEGTFGSDSAPDWDGGNLEDAAPYDHTNADPRTWSSSSPTSRLDRFNYTDSVIRVANRFVLNTATMGAPALSAASPALSSTDTANASDHLPAVVDFELGAAPAAGSLLINEFIFDDAGADDREFLEIINVGGQEVNLDAPLDYHYVRSNAGMPTSAPGAENEAGWVDLTGVVPAGGLFVVYDGSGTSAGIASKIESALPALQRQDSGFLALANGTNTGIALITTETVNGGAGTVNDTLVEAYGYEISNTGNTYFLRTDSDNGLTISLSGNELTTFSGGTDSTVSRQVGNATNGSFVNWQIPDTETAGSSNNTVPVELSIFTIE